VKEGGPDVVNPVRAGVHVGLYVNWGPADPSSTTAVTPFILTTKEPTRGVVESVDELPMVRLVTPFRTVVPVTHVSQRPFLSICVTVHGMSETVLPTARFVPTHVTLVPAIRAVKPVPLIFTMRPPKSDPHAALTAPPDTRKGMSRVGSVLGGSPPPTAAPHGGSINVGGRGACGMAGATPRTRLHDTIIASPPALQLPASGHGRAPKKTVVSEGRTPRARVGSVRVKLTAPVTAGDREVGVSDEMTGVADSA